MSINEFLSTKNINLIWLVIQEEEIIQKQSNEFVENVIQFIQSTLYDFFEKEKGKVKNLQELNKRFIVFILNYITSLIHQHKQTYTHTHKQSPTQTYTPKNHIINLKETPELVTIEEIKKKKLDNFDRELQEKQNEFSNAIKNYIPETPNFSDKLDTPLTESELLVNKMVEQRRMEEEYFKQSSTDENWIKPIETSIKKTKIMETVTSGPIKFIKIENEIDNPVNDIIHLNSSSNSNSSKSNSSKSDSSKSNSSKSNSSNSSLNSYLNNPKHISWNPDLIQFENDDLHGDLHGDLNNELKDSDLNDSDLNENLNEKKEINIFSKLKKINRNEIIIPNTDLDSLKEDIKIMFSKMEDMNTTINNILVWMKENKSN